MIQAFAANRANKSLTKGVSTRRGDRGLENVDACPLSDCPDVMAVFAVIVAQKEARRLTERRGFSDLLRHPGIRWVAGDTDMYHSPRADLDDNEDKQRAKQQVKDLNEIASPNLVAMIMHKRPPRLGGTRSTVLRQILLDRALVEGAGLGDNSNWTYWLGASRIFRD